MGWHRSVGAIVVVTLAFVGAACGDDGRDMTPGDDAGMDGGMSDAGERDGGMDVTAPDAGEGEGYMDAPDDNPPSGTPYELTRL